MANYFELSIIIGWGRTSIHFKVLLQKKENATQAAKKYDVYEPNADCIKNSTISV